MKQLTEGEWHLLRRLRTSLLHAIKEGGGMRVCERASDIKYHEDKATVLQHVHEVPNCPATVMSEVALHGLQVPTWATTRELYAIPEWLKTVPSKEHFCVVAFVRVPGEVRGGKALSEGMFCVLCQRDPLGCQIIYDGTGQSFPMYNICRDKETVGAGMRSFVAYKGKVLLYPIECLVPVTPQSKAEEPRSISDEYADELKYIAGQE